MIYNLTDDAFISNGSLSGKVTIRVRQYDNRLWAVCSDGSLVFSNNGDPSTWDSANIILLPNWEKIIDFLPVQGGVILLSKTSAYAMYGSGSYLDTSIILIQEGLLLSDSAITVDNTVYVLGNRGVHIITLSGMKPLPADQVDYFDSNYAAWNAISGGLQGIFLYKFNAILYLFATGFAGAGFLYNIHTGAFQKVSQELPAILPYMEAMNHPQVDFLVGTGNGTTICRSIYPAGVLESPRTSIIQTRHEDADSLREKVWRHLAIYTSSAVPNVTILLYLDGSSEATELYSGQVNLVAGENIIELYDLTENLPRSTTMSVAIHIGGAISDMPSDFVIKQIRFKYRLVGLPV